MCVILRVTFKPHQGSVGSNVATGVAERSAWQIEMTEMRSPPLAAR
jgi:hypothetical protein